MKLASFGTADWLTTMRAQHKVKRNFIQRLDGLVGPNDAETRKRAAP